MGIFDIFKVKNNLDGILDTLYCTNRNEWTDGYKNKNPTELIKKSKSSLSSCTSLQHKMLILQSGGY